MEKELTPIQQKNIIRLRKDMEKRYYDAPDLQKVGSNAYRFINAVSDILHDIRNLHKDDTDSVPDSSNALKLIRDAQRAMAIPGSYLDVFTAIMCTQLQIRYEKLTEQERTVLKSIMKKFPAYKDSPLSRMKRR